VPVQPEQSGGSKMGWLVLLVVLVALAVVGFLIVNATGG
jgi:hypothetical protein